MAKNTLHGTIAACVTALAVMTTMAFADKSYDSNVSETEHELIQKFPQTPCVLKGCRPAIATFLAVGSGAELEDCEDLLGMITWVVRSTAEEPAVTGCVCDGTECIVNPAGSGKCEANFAIDFLTDPGVFITYDFACNGGSFTATLPPFNGACGDSRLPSEIFGIGGTCMEPECDLLFTVACTACSSTCP